MGALGGSSPPSLEGPQPLCRSLPQAGPHQFAHSGQILVCVSQENTQTCSPWHDPAASRGMRVACMGDGHIVLGCRHASKRTYANVCGGQRCPPSPALLYLPSAHPSCTLPAWADTSRPSVPCTTGQPPCNVGIILYHPPLPVLQLFCLEDKRGKQGDGNMGKRGLPPSKEAPPHSLGSPSGRGFLAGLGTLAGCGGPAR